MTTIKDIAREAGVSVGTVSNVLSGKNNVKPESYTTVIAAAKKLNYNFKSISEQLNHSASGNIGLIIPDILSPFFPEIVRGVEDVALTAKYNVFICNSDRTERKEWDYIQQLINKKVEGIIIYLPRSSIIALNTVSRKTAITLIEAKLEMKGLFNIVNSDENDATVEALNYLYNCGHRRIAYICGQREAESSIRRLNTYKKFLVEKNIEVDETLIKNGSTDWHSGYTNASILLRLKNPPTAVFAASDLMAIGAIMAVKERGLRVPEDVSILGYDDLLLSEIYSPRLTTIRQPKYEIGVQSAEMLIRQIEQMRSGKASIYQYEQIRNEFIIRESVAFVAHEIDKNI